MQQRGCPGFRHAARGFGVCEDRIDKRQHRHDRSEGDIERTVMPGALRRAHAVPQPLPPVVEGAEIGPLEAVDRLFAVTDREDRAAERILLGLRLHLPRAGAGEEFGRQAAGDGPLRGRRILHLIQQKMIEPWSSLKRTQAAPGSRSNSLERRMRSP